MPTDHKGPVVLLFADTQLRVAPEPVRFVHAAIQANTPSSLEAVGRFTIQFNPSYHRIVLHRLRILRGSEALDRLDTVRITFLQRETALDQGVHTGNVTASLLVNDLRVGDVLEYAYSREGQNPVFGGKYVEELSWDLGYHVGQRRVSLLAPASRPMYWRMIGGEKRGAVRPTEADEAGQRRWIWEGRALPRANLEERTPASSSPLRSLALSEFADWTAVSTWADDLFRVAQGPAVAAMGPVLAELRAKATPADQVAGALTWVQKEVRYVSLSLGEGSHRPASPAETLERRWGDCKDKSALLVHLLRELGITARPVLVAAGNPRGVSRQLPSPLVFDHVIVQVELGNERFHVDPTRLGQGGRLAAMGQRWEDAEVLVVQPQVAQPLLTIARSPFDLTRRDELVENLKLPRFGGPGELSVRRTWRGIDAEFMRVQSAEASDEAVVRFLLKPYERRYPGYEVVEKVRLEDDVQNNEVSAVFKLKIPSPALNEKDQWRVLYEASNFEQLVPLPESSQREQPYGLPPRGRYRYALDIDFPDTVAGRNDPRLQELRDPAFQIATVHAFRGNRASMTADLQITEHEVAPARLADYMNAVRRLRTAERGSFWTNKAALDRASVPPAERDNAAARTEKQLAERWTRVNRSLESGLLKGDDLANAHCEKARLLGWRQDEAALPEAQKAVRQSPNHAGLLGCLGAVQLALGRFREAAESFSTAVVMQPDDAVFYFQRGRAWFHAGQLERAAEDFKRAGDRDLRNDHRHYARLWEALTLRRLGKPADAELLREAADHAKAEWPVPALAMLHGLIPPEDLLSAVERKGGLDRELTLAEAHFYAGQWWLAQGDAARAADAFRRTQAFGVVSYAEHQSAGHELRRLESVK